MDFKLLYTLLIKLQAARNIAFQTEQEIKSSLNEYCEKNRVHKDGDIVEVYNALNGNMVGKGIVGSAKTCVWTDDILLNNYEKEFPETKNLERDANNILYEIFHIKKNGEKSSKHFFQQPHYIVDVSTFELKVSDYYIKKLSQ